MFLTRNVRFRNLVGNISNLQLRAERWYFNAPYMLKGELWDEKRLQQTIVRAYKYFKPEKCNQKEHKELIDELENSANIIETLCKINPERTIPPYEDQNNRRPPLDQTIWLSPVSLNKKYGEKWVSWAESFANDNNDLLDKLDIITSYSDRKSRIKTLGGNPLPKNYYMASYVLQRVMDFNKLVDKFKLRLLTKNRFKPINEDSNNDCEIGLSNLINVIGKDSINDFKDFAISYYREVELMKNSTWIQLENSLFERADIHPPMKNKKDILQILIGNILSGDKNLGNIFISDIWLKTICKRSTVKSLCCSIEDSIKKYQGEFNFLYNQVLRSKSIEKPEEKEFIKIKENVDKVSLFIKIELNLEDRAYQKINNPYTLAQLYNLIEADKSGFSSTSLAAHLENNWRMQEIEGYNCARCCRLASDPIRPFDGVLRKVLDRNAWELVKIFGENIKNKANQENLTNGEIDATFLIEQNVFNFAEDLNEIKKNLTKNDKDQLKKLNDKQIERWNSKTDRIKNASKGICPYTGKELGSDGEIDHIIARANTTKSMGTIFNSEANLIHVSKEGNRYKDNNVYYLKNLNSKYLKVQFGTDDIKTIENKITEVVNRLKGSNRIKYYQSLDENEQRCVRHALFLPNSSEARKVVERNLANLNQSVVNGTQSWFIKECTLKLMDYLNVWCKKTNNKINIRSFKIQTENVHHLRLNLSKFDQSMVKRESDDSLQSVSSHAIDALCVYGAALDNKDICYYVGGESVCDNNEKAIISNIHSLFPSICEIKNIKSKEISEKDSIFSKPVFKETIYGSNFLPIMLYKDQVRIGFLLDKNNNSYSVQVEGKNTQSFVDQVSKYLTIKIEDLQILKEKSKNSIVTLHIDKKKAWNLICKVASSEHTIDEKNDSEILTSLHYVTLKTPIFMTEQNGSLCTKDKILNKKSFTIKINVKSIQKNLFKASGNILLPAYNDWCKIFNLPCIEKFLGSKANTYNIEDLNSLLKEQKMWSNGSVMKHSKIKTQMSLPRLGKESGIFAINRTNYKGEKITQLYNSNIKYKGFSSSNGVVDWKKTILYSQLSSNSISPFKESEYSKVDNITLMNEQRLIINEKSIKIFMSPSTGDRRQIKVSLPFDNFKIWMEELHSNEITNKWNLRDVFKIDEDNNKNFSCKFVELFDMPICKGLLGKPREGKLNIVQTGDIIVFYYNVESSSTDMNNAYNQAVS